MIKRSLLSKFNCNYSKLFYGSFRSGIALIELMVAMGIMAIMLPALVTAFFAARGGNTQREARLNATASVREAKEAIRVVRDAGWENIEAVTLGAPYHPVVTNNTWTLVSGVETVDPLYMMTRQVVLGPAYRDGANNLVTTGGLLDPSVKHVIITVSWGNFLLSSSSSEYYLMRFENLTWAQTTLSDFNAGTQEGTLTTNVAGGEVILGSGGVGHADWCAPTLTLAQVDLPKSGVANAVSATAANGGAAGHVIAGTGDNAAGVSLGNVNVTDANPPSATLYGSFDGYKTNGVFVADRYAYIGTDTNSEEVVIIDLNNYDAGTGKFAKAGYFNPSGAGNGTGIYVVGATGFVTNGNKLYTFDVSNPTLDASVTQKGVVTLAGAGARVVVVGAYAYVSESSGTRPLEIVSFNPDGSNLQVVGWASIANQNGVDVVVNSTGTRAYLATSQGNMYILNTSDKVGSLPAVISSFNTNGMTPKGVAVVTNNKAIVVGTGGSLQYQVVDIENENNPQLCTRGGTTSGGLTIPTGVNGIAGVQEEDGDTYSYIITGDAAAELKIIQGGAGGGGGAYANSGTFDTQYFDATRSATFNRFEANVTTPVDTSMGFQVAITNPVAGSCAGATYSFVGPDKTANTQFGTSGQIPLGSAPGFVNPGQCIKMRVIMNTGNTNNTPILYDIMVNYSP